LLCVINGTTCGHHWSPAAARAELRHAHAVEMAREGVPLIVIQRQLGHSNLGITSVYLQGIDSGEIIETVHAPTGADDSRQRITAALIDCDARRPLVAQSSSPGGTTLTHGAASRRIEPPLAQQLDARKH
jgi:Phage integrase family